MGDKGKILFGLSVFVILVTYPFWSRLAASGDFDAARPTLEYPADEAACVEDLVDEPLADLEDSRIVRRVRSEARPCGPVANTICGPLVE